MDAVFWRVRCEILADFAEKISNMSPMVNLNQQYSEAIPWTTNNVLQLAASSHMFPGEAERQQRFGIAVDLHLQELRDRFAVQLSGQKSEIPRILSEAEMCEEQAA